METLMKMSFEEFVVALETNKLPRIELKPRPKLLRSNTGTFNSYESYLLSLYSNRNHFQYYDVEIILRKYNIPHVRKHSEYFSSIKSIESIDTFDCEKNHMKTDKEDDRSFSFDSISRENSIDSGDSTSWYYGYSSCPNKQ